MMLQTSRHAEASVKKFGGKPEDYTHIHDWFYEPRAWARNNMWRMFRHHSEGIFELEERFGSQFTNSDGRVVYTRYVGEQHVLDECFGYIPSAKEWLVGLQEGVNPGWTPKPSPRPKASIDGITKKGGS